MSLVGNGDWRVRGSYALSICSDVNSGDYNLLAATSELFWWELDAGFSVTLSTVGFDILKDGPDQFDADRSISSDRTNGSDIISGDNINSGDT